MRDVNQLFSSFENLSVLIIGDVMIDRYLSGSADRISPEAPVPVVNLQTTENRLGGASNVALNIKSLGAIPLLCSVIGEDENGVLFKELLSSYGLSAENVIKSPARRTTIKTRVIAGNQHLLRVDSEDTFALSPEEEEQLLNAVLHVLEKQKVAAILFQDYNKGVLTPNVIRKVIKFANERQIPTVVDPKKENFFTFQGVTLFKPNLKEVKEAISAPVEAELNSLNEATAYLKAELNHRFTLITLSEKGLYLHDGHKGKLFPTFPRVIADVCGAGDTVVSMASLALALGLPPEEIAILANLAGGQVCEKVGVVPVDKNQLQAEYAGVRTHFVST